MHDIKLVYYERDLINPETPQWQVWVNGIYVCAFTTKEEADDFIEKLEDDYYESLFY